MHIKAVFIRFYKSFNHDYLRKLDERAREKAQSWDFVGSTYYPFVRIPIHNKITTIVGANESGKSHLLSAIEKGLTGVGIADEDFCRYSQFFLVGKGEMRFPDFGFEWCHLTSSEKDKLREISGILETHPLESFFSF